MFGIRVNYKSFLLLILALANLFVSVQSFHPVPLHTLTQHQTLPRPSTRLYFFQQVPTDPDKKKPMDYVCKDCGYVFTKGTIAWDKLDNSKYQCPPCGAGKFRFKKVPKGSEKGEVKVKKSWF